mgnify:CR=1 FL=1
MATAFVHSLHQHPLLSTTSHDDDVYRGGFVCNACRQSSPTTRRWHCPSCLYDLCTKCFSNRTQAVQSHVHKVVKIPGEGCGEYACGFRCDECGKSSSFRWHCVAGCLYDLCETCGSRLKKISRSVAPRANIKQTTPLSEEDECVVCFSDKKDSAFIHGEVGHVACCYRCAIDVQERGMACPICKEDIELVVKLHFC